MTGATKVAPLTLHALPSNLYVVVRQVNQPRPPRPGVFMMIKLSGAGIDEITFTAGSLSAQLLYR